MNSIVEAAAAAAAAGAPAPVDVRIVRDFSALEALGPAWNALAERARTRTVFQTWEMHASWWQAFGAGAELMVIVAESGGRLVGIAPLMSSARRVLGRRRRVVEFIGARALDYTDFIVDEARPDVLHRLLAELASRAGEYDLVYLRDIPAASGTIEALRAVFEGRLPLDVRELYKAPARRFDDPAADRQLPNKKSLKRHYNHFAKSGRLEFRNIRCAAQTLPYLELFFEQHIGRRAETDTPSLFLDERSRRFFRELATRLGPTGQLLFSVVTFDDKPIAMHFGFEYRGCITWYKPSFEMSLAKHSPGEVLIRYLLEYALESGARELDFTIGEEGFKHRFANVVRANCAVRIYRSRAAWGVSRLLLATRAFVERRPELNRLARRLFARLRGAAWV